MGGEVVAMKDEQGRGWQCERGVAIGRTNERIGASGVRLELIQF